MAGTATILEYPAEALSPGGAFDRIQWTWVATAGGIVSGADSITLRSYTGFVVGLVTIPDAGSAPTNLYDITILDTDGVDVMNGAGIDRSDTVTEQTAGLMAAGVPRTLWNTTLTLTIAVAGNAGEGIAILYILRR